MTRSCFTVLVGVAVLAVQAAAAPPGDEPRATLTAAASGKAGAPAETAADRPGLELGDYPRAANAVVDGDTIKVVGLSESLRLLGVDAEETFKNEADRSAAKAGFAAYLKAKRGSSSRPVKMATPMGEAAKEFAKRFFAGVTSVRLERDHPQEIRDRYGRYLSYVLVKKGDLWSNYNVECVRAGLSPYFVKYGNSRRYHDAFVKAQEEARAAHRGIWDETAEHYPDYDERLSWWRARAEFVAAFDEAAAADAGHINLARADAATLLAAQVGKKTAVLGGVAAIRDTGKGVVLVLLGRSRGADFPLVFFKKEVLAATGIEAAKDELLVARGKVSVYHSKVKDTDELQIVIDDAAQVTTTAAAGRPGASPRR
ncbi:MAG: thermonuclease family protein [Deltaproteobacteria bacterium]|nr:thermonuclease family protein [Deltaproteobacteria bacterium]